MPVMGRTPGSRRMGFFVPSPYDDAGSAPPPADGSGVAVVQAEARMIAVCTSFAGYATDGECARASSRSCSPRSIATAMRRS